MKNFIKPLSPRGSERNAMPPAAVILSGAPRETVSCRALSSAESKDPDHAWGINADSGNSGPGTIPHTLRIKTRSARSDVQENSLQRHLLPNHPRDLSTSRWRWLCKKQVQGAPLKMTGAKGLVQWWQYRMFDSFWLRPAALSSSVLTPFVRPFREALRSTQLSMGNYLRVVNRNW